MSTDHVWSVVKGDKGEWRLRVDAPGERAVSAPIGDPYGFVASVAQSCGLDVEVDQATHTLLIDRPEPDPLLVPGDADEPAVPLDGDPANPDE